MEDASELMMCLIMRQQHVDIFEQKWSLLLQDSQALAVREAPSELPSRGKARKFIKEPDAEKDQKPENEDTEGSIKKKLNNMFRSSIKLKQIMLEVSNGGTTLGQPDLERCTRYAEVQQRREPRKSPAAPAEPPHAYLRLWQ